MPTGLAEVAAAICGVSGGNTEVLAAAAAGDAGLGILGSVDVAVAGTLLALLLGLSGLGLGGVRCGRQGGSIRGACAAGGPQATSNPTRGSSMR